MIDPQAAPYLLAIILAAVLLLRDLRSLKNLEGFFDSAEKVLDDQVRSAPVADDISEMSRSLMSARLARRMAVLAFQGTLSRELREPGPRVRAFAQRWHQAGAHKALRDVPRRFVWELTRTSLVFGSLFGLWLLTRGAQHWRDGEENPWAVLAGVAVSARLAERH